MTIKNIKLFNFEGRYEKQDELNFRYFEITQLKNGGFLVSGTKFDISNNCVKPFTLVIKGSKNETHPRYLESLEKIKKFINQKFKVL